MSFAYLSELYPESKSENESDKEYKFQLKFPEAKFGNLISNCSDLETDDDCEHYIDKTTGIIYSYDMSERKWIKVDERDKKQLMILFTPVESTYDETKLQRELTMTYPSVNWINLKKQRSDMFTKDGCIHYLDTKSNKIYSYNSIENRGWMQHSYKYQQSLMHLFNLT